MPLPTRSHPRRPRPAAFDDGEAGVELGTFEAKYLGSVSVKASQGNDVCADAVLRIRVRLLCGGSQGGTRASGPTSRQLPGQERHWGRYYEQR